MSGLHNVHNRAKVVQAASAGISSTTCRDTRNSCSGHHKVLDLCRLQCSRLRLSPCLHCALGRGGTPLC